MIRAIQTLQSLAQAGLAYTKDSFDRQRFEAIQKIVVELLGTYAGLPLKQAELIIFDEQGYRTPKVDVRGAVFRGSQILLVQEKSDGCWCLPGGWADVNESPRQAVEREVREETGLHTQAKKLVALHDTQYHGPKQYYHSYKLIFLCEYQAGTPGPTEETTAVGYFDRDQLPTLSERRTTREQIELLFDHHGQAERPTAFD